MARRRRGETLLALAFYRKRASGRQTFVFSGKRPTARKCVLLGLSPD
jgi:hypothetical protein